MQRIAFRAMGCRMMAAIEASGLGVERALAEVPSWFATWERTLSRFLVESELNVLNAHAGEWVTVSETLWQVLCAALDAARWTNGLFDPTILNALRRAGYNQSFEQIRAAGLCVASEDTLRADQMGGEDWSAIELDARQRAVCLPAGLQLDLGGIAKGWCADQAARRLSAYGPALVDAGGDIAVAAGPQASEAFSIGLAAPGEEENLLGIFLLSQGGVATSGRDYRHWQTIDGHRHHIIDPRTGQPAETDLLTATVIAPSAMEADVAATVALILGSQAGLNWIATHSQLSALVVCQDGTIMRTSNFPSLTTFSEKSHDDAQSTNTN